jgi:hypothetical protein
MQKHKFGVTCLGALFVETALCPPEHEKWCIDFFRLGRTSTHYVTRRSLSMEKHKFGVTCSSVLLVESVPIRCDHEK